MGNILTFLDEYGGFSFTEKPLCEVDAMILTYLSYFNYASKVSDFEHTQKRILLKDTLDIVKRKDFLSVKWEQEQSIALFIKTIFTRRYRNTRVMYYYNEICKKEDLQFCGVTFQLGNGDIFISFRGTDDALTGWKEDFFMACRTPVASQIKSVEYVERVYDFFQRKRNARFYIGGHSKGGNLAVYAVMNCNEKIRSRVGRVFNFDGPGFRNDFFDEKRFECIKEKVIKLVPKDSFVGNLLEDESRIECVESTEIGMLQHMPESWMVEGDKFIRSTEISQRRLLFDKVNEWILSMDVEKTDMFLQTLFGVVEDVETLSELTGEWFKNSTALLRMYGDMDKEMQGMFWEFSVLIIELVGKDQKERIRKWRLINNIRTYMDNIYGDKK